MDLFRRSRAYSVVADDLAQGMASHAYLLVCPDARNLRSFLKELAALLVCDTLPECERDRAARLIRAEGYADCRVFPAAGEKCGVAEVRALLDESILKPVEAARKVFVLDAVQDMLAPAQNKLLKVLEEPPANVHFVLGATNEFSVLATVRSRVKRLDLLSFAEADIEAYLREQFPSRTDARELAALSGGVLGTAEELASSPRGEDGAEFLLRLSPAGVPACARAAGTREQAARLLATLRLTVRDMLVFALGKDDLVLGERTAALERAACKFSVAEMVRAEERIGEAERALRGNANPAATVETLLLGILEES